jgi:hypothetical protein
LFSVSKNSGRIMIHYEKSKEASLVSFDLEEILTNEVVDHMMEAKLDRRLTGTSISLDFVDSALVKGTSHDGHHGTVGDTDLFSKASSCVVSSSRGCS